MLSQILLASLGSSGLFAFIEYLITRKDRRGDQIKAISEHLDKLEKDSCRTQILLMLSDYSTCVPEIMKLAEHYFKDLKGDWYLSSLFTKWLRENNIPRPDWVNDD